ncbi:MAG: hypothetical protein WCC50_21690, partial [Pseudolabrys sp.]
RYGRAAEKSDEVSPLHVAPRLDSEPSTSRLGGELEMADPECPLWVISGHFAMREQCPLYPKSVHRQSR